jgi:hypothetical protein
MLAKVMKPAIACSENNNNMNTINIRDISSSSREASNIQQGHQLDTGNSREAAAETIEI